MVSTPKRQQPVHVHQGSNLRKEEQKRKTVFKHVLDSPYSVKWPSLDVKEQDNILDVLCKFLEPIGNYHRQRKAAKPKKPSQRNKRKRDSTITTDDITMTTDFIQDALPQPPPTPPELLASTTIGINAVTKQLEQCITTIRSREQPPEDSLAMVFVCKGDIAPPHLVGHLPMMTCMAGGQDKEGEGARTVLLCPLARGAEKKIGDAIGIKTCSVIGIKPSATSETYAALSALVRSKVEPVHAPWLLPTFSTRSNPSPRPAYLATNIKTLRTSAPLANKKPKRIIPQKTSGVVAATAAVSTPTTPVTTSVAASPVRSPQQPRSQPQPQQEQPAPQPPSSAPSLEHFGSAPPGSSSAPFSHQLHQGKRPPETEPREQPRTGAGEDGEASDQTKRRKYS
ncbi:hypothetical protein BC936DRAFT_145167 [Jimgerdemannia flammicorona]|uniref:Ribosomal protein L7Ae/L30e/S12e/Gadd45 domain-containing protein n=1 Tax=Jimgerdemannia flammicorona TaxID=994334 RepID=A0A433DAS2_9FUNG|nr:hypothetical protein BC936DRAFT_145167 [Jimgerdemannia flammicorona]